MGGRATVSDSTIARYANGCEGRTERRLTCELDEATSSAAAAAGAEGCAGDEAVSEAESKGSGEPGVSTADEPTPLADPRAHSRCIAPRNATRGDAARAAHKNHKQARFEDGGGALDQNINTRHVRPYIRNEKMSATEEHSTSRRSASRVRRRSEPVEIHREHCTTDQSETTSRPKWTDQSETKSRPNHAHSSSSKAQAPRRLSPTLLS